MKPVRFILSGAIQEGIHRFPNSDSENTENSSIAQFIHLWLIENEEWKISRVFSFDHN